jgi:hypothetical protein
MQHVIGVYFRKNTSHRFEVFPGIKFPTIFLFLCLFISPVKGQELQEEVIIVSNDSIVVLKKRATSVSISVTIKNRSNADTLIIKNVTGMVYPGLVYFAPDTPHFENECNKSKLEFRIEGLSGEIVQPQYINTDNDPKENSVYFHEPKERPVLLSSFIKKKQVNNCFKRGSISLFQDSTFIVCPYLEQHSLSKGIYYLYIYYCNSYDTTYSLNYESTLIQTIPSVGRVPKKVFIGQFSSQPIKLIVK